MTDNTITHSETDFDWFKNNGIFMPMINDTGRNIFYKTAIERAVPGRVVCDIGTGTGFLSVLAAKAGAKKVYAVEMDPGRADFARKVVNQLGLNETIEVINENFFNTAIQADIYVSETIGSQIFNEDIIAISQHATKNGGEFIPGTFEVFARVYENHPIFPLVQSRSEAFEFQPDIEIDSGFENIINAGFQQQHGLDNTLYRANCIQNLFSQLHKFTDLKLTTLYETEPIVVDLNSQADINNIRLVIPNNQVPVSNRDVCVVLFWRAKYQDITMDVVDTIWGNPNKIILPRVRKPGTDIEMWYDHAIQDWRFSF